MELFYVLAISANVLLTAVCAYCLSLAVSKNSNDPENAFLQRVTRYTRKLVIFGGAAFIAFLAYTALMFFLLTI